MPRVFTLLIITLSCLPGGNRFLFAQPASAQHHTQLPVVDPLNVRSLDSIYNLYTAHINGRREFSDVKSDFLPVAILPGQPVTRSQHSFNRGNVVGRQIRTPIIRGEEAICYTESARNFLFQDSLVLWTANPTLTADGNVLISGEFADYSRLPKLFPGGFCMKTDILGNIIWATLIDSTIRTEYGYQNYSRVLELHDGSIVLAGRCDNRVTVSDDFILTKLDKNGNILWIKTYQSRLWKRGNGSADMFSINDLKEDPATGDIYFVGSHWFSAAAVTKVDGADGHILWSNAYDSYESDYAFGIIINTGNLLLFQLSNGYYNENTITATAINKQTGDSLFSKHYSQTGDRYSPRIYQPHQVKQLNNGHFLLSGPTTGFFEFPVYTGTKDLYHEGVIELDENLNYVQAYGFKNRIDGNGSNTKLSFAPDGTGLFTMFEYISGYAGESEVCIFRNKQIFHQRKRQHLNEGLPYEPYSLPMKDGGWLNIKMMGDSTKLGIDGTRIDYYRIHSTDTASVCLGMPDTANSFWAFNFEPIYYHVDTIARNIFHESQPKSYQAFNFGAHPGPACAVISYCDTLDLKTSTPNVCLGSTLTITAYKNKACGSLVPLVYDTTWVSKVEKKSDSTWALHFSRAGEGYIRASLLGCSLREDSVFVQVTPALTKVDIGPDTVLCPGNSITLNAGSGFVTYRWQNISTNNSTYTVTAPGKYLVSVVNNCGDTFYDTVIVTAHPPVPISLGPDKTLCRNDTAHLVAPDGFLNYNWGNGYRMNKTTGQEVVVDPLVDTAYHIMAEKTPGCFAYDTIRIIVKQFPPVSLGNDTAFCAGDSIVMDAGSGFANWHWNIGTSERIVTAKTTGTYIATGITAEGCKVSDTLQVLKVYPVPQVNLGNDSVLCNGTQRMIDAGSYSKFIWSTGDTTRQIIIPDTGFYSVQVADANQCTGNGSVHFSKIVWPPAHFLPGDTAVCNYGEIVLAATHTYKAYTWNTGKTTSAITTGKAGIYWLQATDENDCTGSDTIVVRPKECLKGLFVPTAFTPNLDGKNDNFRPLIYGIALAYEWWVYNRYGELIFNSNDPQRGWDGRFKGILQEQGNYIWKCSYQLAGELLQIKSGSVLLLR